MKVGNSRAENNISWEECYNNFIKATALKGSHTLNAWSYFTSVYDEIPQQYRLKIQLLGIYIDYRYNQYEFYKYLKRTLDEETVEQKEARIKENTKILKKYLCKDYKNIIKLYRGVNDYSLPEEYALSYTIDREKAEWFSNRFNKSGAVVIEEDFNIADVLLYTNDRDEKEVIVIPPFFHDDFEEQLEQLK